MRKRLGTRVAAFFRRKSTESEFFLQTPLKLFVSVVTIGSFLGRSLFGPRLQTITVSSEPEGANVTVNGSHVGQTPLRFQVSRGEDLLIEIRKTGYQAEYRHTHRTLSTLGILDVIGGAIFLLPFFGLFSSAAWEHDPAAYGVVLTPASASAQP